MVGVYAGWIITGMTAEDVAVIEENVFVVKEGFRNPVREPFFTGVIQHTVTLAARGFRAFDYALP